MNFRFNNVYAEDAPKAETSGIVKGEIEIETDEIDQYGLLKRSKTRKERQLDDIIPEVTKDEDETALEIEASIN